MRGFTKPILPEINIKGVDPELLQAELIAARKLNHIFWLMQERNYILEILFKYVYLKDEKKRKKDHLQEKLFLFTMCMICYCTTEVWKKTQLFF